MISRRDVIKGGGAVAVAVALPVPSGAGTVAPLAPLPAWGVGVDDEGHTIQFARTAHEAVLAHMDEVGLDVCEACRRGDACEDPDGDWCDVGRVEAQRAKRLDSYHDHPHDIDHVALRSIGWCVPCAWCDAAGAYMDHTEYPSAYDTSVVDGEVVCHECIAETERAAQRGQ